MNNKQVAHLWANKSKASAKGSNFYFNNTDIYSYSTLIGKIYSCEVIFIDSRNYSVTTQKQKRYIYNAIDKNKYQIIECPKINFIVKSIHFSNNKLIENINKKDCHIDNLKYFLETIKDLHNNFNKSKKYKELIQNKINEKIKQYKKYCEIFNLKINNNIINFDNEKYKIEVEKEKIKNAKLKVKIEKEKIKKEQEKLNYFFNNDKEIKTLDFRYGTNFGKIVGEKFVTNSGAEVLASEVTKILKIIDLKSDLKHFEIGNFRIDYRDEKGIKIGCHFFDNEEIERIKKLFK